MRRRLEGWAEIIEAALEDRHWQPVLRTTGFARHTQEVPLEAEAHFTYPGEVIAGRPKGAGLDTARRILAAWP